MCARPPINTSNHCVLQNKVFTLPSLIRPITGIAFPTCLNINNILCHFAPIKDDEDDPKLTTLHTGDIVKIELGVHSGGYPALLAFSIVVGGDMNDPLLVAARQILQVHLQEIRAGVDTHDAAKKIQQFVSGLDVKFFEGKIQHEYNRSMNNQVS